MKWWLGQIALIAALIAGRADGKYEVLFGETFEESLAAEKKSGKNAVILFLAPWCGNCKNFHPKFEEAHRKVEELEKTGIIPPVFFGEIDADAYRDIGDKYEIEAFPTIKWFTKDGEVEDYDGDHSAEGLVKFIRKQTSNPVTKLENNDDLTRAVHMRKHLDIGNGVVILCGKPDSKEASNVLDALIQTSKNTEADHEFFAYTSGTPLADLSAVLKKNGLTATGTVPDLSEGLVVVKPLEYGFEVISFDGLRNYKVRGDDDGEENEDPEYLASMTMEEREDYFLSQVEDFIDRAAVVPSAVADLTQANFTQVLQNTEFVLVEFMAPWCGYCKKLAPVYEQLAQNVKDRLKDKSVLIAKVDATAEEALAEKFKVEGFPTIRWFRKGEYFDAPFYEREDPEKMYNWVLRMMQPVWQETLKGATKADVDALVDKFKSNDSRSVGFFAYKSTDAADLATRIESAAYGYTFPFFLLEEPSEEIWAKYVQDTTVSQAFIMFNEEGFKSVTKKTEPKWNDDATLRRAVRLAVQPTVVLFSDDFLDDAIDNGAKSFIIFIGKTTDPALDAFKAAARKRKEPGMLYTNIDNQNEEMEFALEFFKADEDKVKNKRLIRAVFVEEDDIGGEIFRLASKKGGDILEVDDVTEDRVLQFVDEFLARKLEPMELGDDEDYDGEGDEEQGEYNDEKEEL